MKKTLLCTLIALLPLAAQAAPVKVAVAANMQYAFSDIATAFTRDTGVAVQPSYSSSGKFATQVMAGAPFELFLSADNTFPQKLQGAGFTLNAPKTYAIGTLVLWSLDKQFDAEHWQQWLKSAGGKVAIANPQTAPYGTEAVHALNYYHLSEAVQPRLVTGDSIGQTAQFVSSGAAQAGFVAKSQVVSAQMQGQGRWVELPAQSHDPIIQDMVLLKPAAANPDARKLFDYLQSPAARAILQRYGYRLP
ncbi:MULTISPECIES: molybdate ABC transporter substrate-binding protein [unclassified Paludibacterium]|uniref:molybdate ABC transporter substrate-binding protein n=1 Tax=unclassified Paludibacterium TaxID=2618429 RepID=UPI001C05E26B|nr:molybdate ABC transporter substrate-binding protein [Paludibacterium sp. B53371]BEV71233.1 molybdate ABC transporter substrate-binding protein [Paludibacterium sp. THUN1379]